MGYLSNLIAITPTSAHAVYYAGIVREMSKLRSIIVQAAKMSSDAYEERPSQEVAEAGVRGLLKLRTGNWTVWPSRCGSCTTSTRPSFWKNWIPALILSLESAPGLRPSTGC